MFSRKACPAVDEIPDEAEAVERYVEAVES